MNLQVAFGVLTRVTMQRTKHLLLAQHTETRLAQQWRWSTDADDEP
jgi:hypothetical protein